MEKEQDFISAWEKVQAIPFCYLDINGSSDSFA